MLVSTASLHPHAPPLSLFPCLIHPLRRTSTPALLPHLPIIPIPRSQVRVATCHLRMGDFGAALSVAGSLLDKLAPSSQHFHDVTKKMSEVEEVARQLGVLRAQVGVQAGRA
jgi:hypothetical protein